MTLPHHSNTEPSSTAPASPATDPPWATAAAFLPFVYRAFPGVSSRVLSDRFLLPWKRLPSLHGGERTRVEVDGQTASYEVTGRGPLVILAHGWSGASGQFTDLRGRLLASGLRVATFDAPAHGSSPGRTTSAAQFMRVIERIASAHGPTHAIVGHSLGGLAAAMSTESVRPRGLALLAPMPSFDFALDQFQLALRFDDRLRQAVAMRVMRYARFEREQAHVERGLERALPTLLIHDTDDRRIPVSISRTLAQKYDALEYVETAGLGHSRLLADAAVLRRVTDFVVGLGQAAQAAAG